MVANVIKVKVYPKDFKSIPDILPYRDLINGPMELELDKKEILRCMNFGDVFDLTTGEEVLIDEVAFKNIVEFVEDTPEENPETPDEPSVDPEPEAPVEDEDPAKTGDELTEKNQVGGVVTE